MHVFWISFSRSLSNLVCSSSRARARLTSLVHSQTLERPIRLRANTSLRNMGRWGVHLCSLLLVSVGSTVCAANDYQAQVAEFINEMIDSHGFEQQRLERLFADVQISEPILEAISRPAEAKPWHRYRPIFVTDKRRNAGVEFWKRHAPLLRRVESEFGVPAEIIVAIIGVETFYGVHKGRYQVIDSLFTLAFGYPKRADFFRTELAHFLLLTREQNVDPSSLTGSYAGAMGIPQFISSSYRSYAVDYNEDGFANIWDDPGDAIASVANYLKKHGWAGDEEIAVRAHPAPAAIAEFRASGLKPSFPLHDMSAAGVRTETAVSGNPDALLLELQNEASVEYWIGLPNFYVITRYNHSALYAMAVYQLAGQVRDGYMRNRVPVASRK